MEQISERAGVSRRTFFRDFDSKTAVLCAEFDHEMETLYRLLREVPAEQPMTEAIREVVVRANHYGVDDVAELRIRMHVSSTLSASATVHYDRWAGALAEFAAQRLGQQPDDLIPQAIGFSAPGVCRAAFDQWVKRHDAEGQVGRALRLQEQVKSRCRNRRSGKLTDWRSLPQAKYTLRPCALRHI